MNNLTDYNFLTSLINKPVEIKCSYITDKQYGIICEIIIHISKNVTNASIQLNKTDSEFTRFKDRIISIQVRNIENIKVFPEAYVMLLKLSREDK